MLDISLKDQLKNIFAVLEAQYTLDITVAPQHESRQELTEMLADVAECTDKISCRIREGKELEFALLKNGEPTGIKFRGSQWARVHLSSACHHECRRERKEFSGRDHL